MNLRSGICGETTIVCRLQVCPFQCTAKDRPAAPAFRSARLRLTPRNASATSTLKWPNFQTALITTGGTLFNRRKWSTFARP
jgi:hypothetical protein